jgi:hypothetical protein
MAARVLEIKLNTAKKIKGGSHRFFYQRKNRVYWCNTRDWHLIRFLLIHWSLCWEEVTLNATFLF